MIFTPNTAKYLARLAYKWEYLGLGPKLDWCPRPHLTIRTGIGQPLR